ncbi:MAG: FtsX-like permease family protein [Labilithrix sp.]|nr:FtsX-like permease family protein [Labilithrix sp.]
MTTLARFAWRELVRAKGRFALIALILTIQAAALGGGDLAQASLYGTRDAWSERLRLADLDVQFVPASADEMPSLEAIAAVPGVAAVNRRFIALGYVEEPAGDGAEPRPLPVVVQYLDPSARPPVNDVELLSGRWLERGRPERAVVDRSFAAAHGLAIGDEIVVNPRRFSTRFEVAGTGLSAEYLVPTANPEMLVPHKGSLGIVYASREALDRTFSEELYNDVVVTFDPTADPRATTDAVLAALGGLEIERVVTKEATFGYRFIDVMLSGSRSVTPIIALIVALMAAIVAFLSVHRLIAERRREIGCLLAQGFSPAQLAACFFALGLAPGVVGGLAGIPAAMAFATQVTRTTAGISGFPDPIMTWDAARLSAAAGSAVLVGLLSALPPALGLLRLRPSEALRGAGEARFAGLPAPLERLLARLEGSGSTTVRYALRNVFRRVGLSLATATLVALAVALPSGLLTSIASWDTWAQDQASRLRWDAIASFKVPLSDAHAREVMADKGVAAWDGYVQGYASVRREDGATEEMRVRGLPARSDLVRLALTAGRPFSGDDADEAIMNTAFSGGRPPRVGERITVVRKGVARRLVVVGVLTDAALSTIVVPRGVAQRVFGLEGKVSGAYVRFGGAPAAASAPPGAADDARATDATSNAEVLERIDLDEAASDGAARAAAGRATRAAPRDPKSALLDDDLVTSVEVRAEYADATLRYLSAFNVIVVPFVGLSGVLAFFFLLSVLGFLLLERETEYATLRSMGYAGAEIARVVFTEVGVLAALGLVISLGTWAATAYALREPMARTWFAIPLDFRAHDFAVASVPTLLFLGLAALPGIRALLRLDLSSSLRGRALG